MDKITNYNFILDKLLSQFKDSNRFTALINGILENANDIETALFEIRDEFTIYTAVGVQLDVIGSIFSVDRNGLIDEDYRTEIQKKAILRYSGEPESIIEAIKTIFGGTEVIYRPFYPGGYYILTDAILLSSQLDPINPAGVRGLLEKYLVDGQGNYIVSKQNIIEKSIVDGNLNNIIDGNGNELVSVQLDNTDVTYITGVLEFERSYIVDGTGNIIVDGNGNIISTIMYA